MNWTGSKSLPFFGAGMIQFGNLSLVKNFLGMRHKLLESGARSRFQTAMLASLAVHALVIFGIGIRPPDAQKASNVSPALEIILVNSKSTTRPANAQILAQQDLDGGGNTDADRRAKSPLPVTPTDKQTSEVNLESRRVEQLEQEARRLMTQINSQSKIDTATTQPQPQTETRISPSAADIMNRSFEIARLEAEISKTMDDYSKRPRRRFLGPSTQEYRFTRYIEDWRVKVERVGTQNYPQAARDQKIYGSLRLTVSIRADGSVEKVEIDRSSGKKVLDEAAIRIVNQAAPYAAFPANISKEVDILSITKTWTFTTSDQLSTE